MENKSEEGGSGEGDLWYLTEVVGISEYPPVLPLSKVVSRSAFENVYNFLVYGPPALPP